MSDTCPFIIAYVGPCNQPAQPGGYCDKHQDLKCVSCGEQAQRQCEWGTSVICGAPLCQRCEGAVTDEPHVSHSHQVRSAKMPQAYQTAEHVTQNTGLKCDVIYDTDTDQYVAVTEVDGVQYKITREANDD